MDERGWDDIGYNFILCNDKEDQQQIYMGRGWTYIGAHCKGYNNESLEEDGRFNGQSVRVGKFCSSWRKKIFEMLLGIQFENPNNIDIADPVSDEFYSYFQNVAKNNTLIYEEVFSTMPTNRARTFAQVNAYNGMPKMKDTDPIEAQQKLNGIQGFVVEYPLYFLDEENYLPSWTTPEGIAPLIIWT
ncbi:unnamed protein product [Rotaria sordida]|uniref:Uncharacterized protein n=2 Tax=Rotaria sordida TaxID=392033 RepID=A0A819J7C3_9BILA|nr:unnamed protein product [Rotaria sordida]